MSSNRAETLKNRGNDEFKKGNYKEAINYYTQAIGKISRISLLTVCVEISPHETLFTNRAASYI